MKCTRCNKTEVEKVDSGELVCTSCGLVLDDFVIGESAEPSGQFCREIGGANLFADQNAPKFIKRAGRAHLSNTMKVCLELIRKLVSKCKLGSDLGCQIESMFLKVVPKYKHKKLPFKLHLAASCVYSALNSSNTTVLLKDFCKLLECEPQQFYSVYVKVRHEFNVPVESSLEESVLAIFKNILRETPEEKEAHCQLVKKTLHIMEFVKKCWLVTGRSTSAMIMACAYFAWKMLDLSRLPYPFDYFYELCKFEGRKSTALERVREMNSIFIKLAKQLPYYENTKLTSNNIAGLLDEIMEHRNFVIDDFCTSSQGRDMCEDKKDKNTHVFKELRRHRKNYKRRRSSNESLPDIIVPPTDEELIPESDWHLYLRSEEQMHNAKIIANMCKK